LTAKIMHERTSPQSAEIRHRQRPDYAADSRRRTPGESVKKAILARVARSPAELSAQINT